MDTLLVTVIVICLLQVGDSIKCHIGGNSPTGGTVLTAQKNCTSKPDGVKYTDKCYLLVMKNDTQYYVRGCLRAEHEAKYCQSAVAIRNFEMSGCCCDKDMCNHDGLRNDCTIERRPTIVTKDGDAALSKSAKYVSCVDILLSTMMIILAIQ